MLGMAADGAAPIWKLAQDFLDQGEHAPPAHDGRPFFQVLPFVAETVSQRRHMEQLEAWVAELDDALRIFSRPKVLVEA